MPLGVEQSQLTETTAEFGALSLVRRPPREILHLAFIADTRDAVNAFHGAGLDAGGSDNGPPGIRSYAPDYYAAYLLDPDGHNVEAVHRSAETRAGWASLRIGSGADPAR